MELEKGGLDDHKDLITETLDKVWLCCWPCTWGRMLARCVPLHACCHHAAHREAGHN